MALFVNGEGPDNGQKVLPPEMREEVAKKLPWHGAHMLSSTCRKLHKELKSGNIVPDTYKPKHGFLSKHVRSLQNARTSKVKWFSNTYISHTHWLALYQEPHDPKYRLALDKLPKPAIGQIAVVFALSKEINGPIENLVTFVSERRTVSEVVLQNERQFDCSDFLLQTKVLEANLFEFEHEHQDAAVLSLSYESGETYLMCFQIHGTAHFSPLHMQHSRIRPDPEELDTLDIAMQNLMHKNFTKAVDEDSRWLQVPDPRRLMSITAAEFNPRPAPSGGKRPAKGQNELTGTKYRMFEQARRLADWIYDDQCVFQQSNNTFLLVPFWAVEHGFSPRAKQQLVRLEFRRRSTQFKCDRYKLLKGSPEVRSSRDQAAMLTAHGVEKPDLVRIRQETQQPEVKKVRRVTLLVRYTDTGESTPSICVLPLPCRLSDSSDVPLSYSKLLRLLSKGWHCWPEMWTRVMMERMMDLNTKGDGDQPIRCTAIIRTDIPLYKPATCAIRRYVGEMLGEHAAVFCSDGGLGYWLGAGDKSMFHLTLGEGHNVDLSFAQVATGLRAIVQAFPGWMKKHSMIGHKGVQAVCIRIELSHKNAFLDSNMTALLAEFGRDGDQVCAVAKDKHRETDQERLRLYLRAKSVEDIHKMMELITKFYN